MTELDARHAPDEQSSRYYLRCHLLDALRAELDGDMEQVQCSIDDAAAFADQLAELLNDGKEQRP